MIEINGGDILTKKVDVVECLTIDISKFFVSERNIVERHIKVFECPSSDACHVVDFVLSDSRFRSLSIDLIGFIDNNGVDLPMVKVEVEYAV